MSRKATILAFEYKELEGKAKLTAGQWLEEGTTLFDWWGNIYEDAKTLGVNIGGFDLYRRTIEISPLNSWREASEEIIKADGTRIDDVMPYAHAYIDEDSVTCGEDCEDAHHDKLKTAAVILRKALARHFLKALQAEEDYLSSEEYKTEISDANEYLFDKKGNPVHHLIEEQTA